MIQMRWIQNIVLIVAAVILLAGVLVALRQGHRAAQSSMVLRNAQSLQQGFAYFFKDQGRYPTTLEYSDKNLMSAYISGFPPPEYTSGQCAQSYDYRNTTTHTYELYFCLPKSAGNWPAGWSKVSPEL